MRAITLEIFNPQIEFDNYDRDEGVLGLISKDDRPNCTPTNIRVAGPSLG